MHSRPLFCFISIVSIVSTLDSDTSWFLNEDLSSNTDYSSNPEYISAALPLDLDFGTGLTTPSTDPYSTEISSNNDDLLWNTDLNNNNNNLFTDNSLLLADCSSSAETFSLIGKKKSRLRRADTPTSCTNDGGVNNANTGVNNGLSLPIEIFSSPDGGLDALNRAVSGSNTEQNSDCVQITQGILPVGVCSTGRLQDTIVAGALSIEGVTFASITLRQVTISPLINTCPDQQSVFHCCKQVIYTSTFGEQAIGCVALTRLNRQLPSQRSGGS